MMADEKEDPPVPGQSPVPDQATVFMPARPIASERGLESGWSPIRVGDVLNHMFEVKRFIARGGMSEVFEGINVMSEERVAIKVMLPGLAEDPKLLAMFRKEAWTLTRLNHAALVQYRVLAQEPQLGVLYIVTEYIDGDNLADVVSALKPSPLDIIQLTKRLAEGLGAAHALGAIHRDISPDNVILEGGRLQGARIIDFGIAKDLTASAATIIGSGFAGKLNYVAPEQLGDYGQSIGPWTDIYSLGLVILAVAAGKDVDLGGTLVNAIDKRRSGPDLSEAPEVLRPMLARMLEPNPANRLQSMEELIKLLPAITADHFARLAAATEDASPPPPPPPPSPPARVVEEVAEESPVPANEPEPGDIEEALPETSAEPEPDSLPEEATPEPAEQEPAAPASGPEQESVPDAIPTPPEPAAEPEPALPDEMASGTVEPAEPAADAAEPEPELVTALPIRPEEPAVPVEPLPPEEPQADEAGRIAPAVPPEPAAPALAARPSVASSGGGQNRLALVLVLGAAVLVVLIGAALWLGGYLPRFGTKEQATVVQAPPPPVAKIEAADPAAVKAALASDLGSVACSWLDAGDVSRSGGVTTAALRGASGRVKDVPAEVRRMLADQNFGNVKIEVRDVAPIDASECQPLDALRQIRDTSHDRVTLPTQRFEMAKQSSGAYAGSLGAKATVDFDLDDPDINVALFGIEPSGKIVQLTSDRKELIGASDDLGNGHYRLSLDVNHTGWSGLVLLAAGMPFDASLLAGPPGSRTGDWSDRFLRAARQQGWSAEMVWFETVDEQPN